MFPSSISSEDIERLQFAEFPGQILVIDKKGKQYDDAIRYLQRQKIIGFDTETRPTFSAGQPRHEVALLQLSGSSKAFLFRTNMVEMDRRLCHILATPKIIKVGAAVNDDIRGLQRRQHFDANGFVDLQKIVSNWGINDKSVKKMSAIILEVRISKAQQLSNWEAEELTESQQKYASTDAWICREMYMKLYRTPMPDPAELATRREQELLQKESSGNNPTI